MLPDRPAIVWVLAAGCAWFAFGNKPVSAPQSEIKREIERQAGQLR